MRGVRPAEGGRAGFRKSEVADLPLPHKPRHCPDGFLNRSVPVHAVLVVEINMIHTQSLQTCLARPADVVRLAVDAEEAAFSVAYVTEFGGQKDFLPSSSNGLPYQFL